MSWSFSWNSTRLVCYEVKIKIKHSFEQGHFEFGKKAAKEKQIDSHVVGGNDGFSVGASDSEKEPIATV